MEREGKLKAVITQNIDGLHQLAGSRKVTEIHGSFFKGHCLACGREYPFQWMRETLREREELRCECGGVVKPDIVFFGEAVEGLSEAGIWPDAPISSLSWARPSRFSRRGSFLGSAREGGDPQPGT